MHRLAGWRKPLPGTDGQLQHSPGRWPLHGERLAVSEITIRKRLNEKGLLASTELSRGTLTVRRTICGELIPVIHLRADVLSVSRVSSDNPNTEGQTAPTEAFSC